MRTLNDGRTLIRPFAVQTLQQKDLLGPVGRAAGAPDREGMRDGRFRARIMSFKVVVWVLDHSEAEQGTRLVALALAENADEDTGECFPSQETVGRRTKLSVRQVRRAIRDLETLGEISTHRAKGVGPSPDKLTNRYVFTAYLAEKNRTKRPDNMSARSEADRTSATGRPDISDHPSGHPRPPNRQEPSEEPSVPLAEQAPLMLVPPIEREKKPRARNPIFDALAEVFPANTKGEQTRIGMVASRLNALDPPPDADHVREVAAAVLREWPDATVMAVDTGWTRMSTRVRRKRSTDATYL